MQRNYVVREIIQGAMQNTDLRGIKLAERTAVRRELQLSRQKIREGLKQSNERYNTPRNKYRVQSSCC